MDKVEGRDDKSTKIERPGGIGVRHVIVVFCFFATALAYGQRECMSVAIVAMRNATSEDTEFETFDWDESEKSFILSSFFWGYIITQMPAGYIANIWSAHKLLSMSMILSGICSALLPIVAKYGGWLAVCACRVIMGLCQSGLYSCFLTIMTKWVPPFERDRSAGIAIAGAQFGGVITFPISGWLASSSLGWPGIFYFQATVSIIFGISFLIWGADCPAKHPSVSQAEREYIASTMGNDRYDVTIDKKIPWKHIFTSAPLWAIMMAHCGHAWGYWTLSTQTPSYFNGVFKIDIKSNGLLSTLPHLTMFLCSIPMTWLADYYARKGVRRVIIRKVVNTIAQWGPAILLIIMALVPVNDVVLPSIMLTVMFAMYAGSVCGFQINHMDLSPNYTGTMASIANFVANIVAIIAPLMVGVIVTDTSNEFQWQIVFYLTAIFFFFGNLVFIIFGKADVQWWNDPKANKLSQP